MRTEKEMLAKARKFVVQERAFSGTGPRLEEVAIHWRSEDKWVVMVDGL